MMNEKRFQQNVAVWARNYPKAAVFLPYLDSSRFSFCKAADGGTNLKVRVGKRDQFYHSAQNPHEESKKWFSKLKLSDSEALCVYGVGLGYGYDAAKKWLKTKRNRRLVFLEDDLNVIRALFETERGSRILKDPQVSLHYFEEADLEDPISTLTDLYWTLMTTKIQVAALPYYETAKEEKFVLLHHKLVYDATIREGVLSEYLDYGAAFFKNFYPNLLRLSDAYLGNDLFGKFKNVPAIICGAGPSLKSQLHTLKGLRDKALIFAGGSALNVLNAADIQPHLGAGIDPNPAQFDRLSTSRAFETPFLYRNRMLQDALKLVHGPRLYIKGSGGYDIAKWFEDQLKIKGDEIEEGFNVVTFSLELANVFGCNPIIFVGVDLAFTKMEKYAPGVIDKSKITKKELTNVSDFDKQALLREDIYGKPIYTLWKWIGESRWIGTFAKLHPDISLINATEGGIGFPGVPNQILKSVARKHLARNYDVAGRLHTEIQLSKMPNVTKSKIIHLMKEMCSSLERCRDHLNVLLEENKEMSKRLSKEKQMLATLQSGRAALAEIEMAEEPGYKYVLDIFNKMYSCVLSRELHKLRIVPGQPMTWNKGVRKLAITTKKLKFLYNVTTVNIEILKHTLANQKD